MDEYDILSEDEIQDIEAKMEDDLGRGVDIRQIGKVSPLHDGYEVWKVHFDWYWYDTPNNTNKGHRYISFIPQEDCVADFHILTDEEANTIGLL